MWWERKAAIWNIVLQRISAVNWMVSVCIPLTDIIINRRKTGSFRKRLLCPCASPTFELDKFDKKGIYIIPALPLGVFAHATIYLNKILLYRYVYDYVSVNRCLLCRKLFIARICMILQFMQENVSNGWLFSSTYKFWHSSWFAHSPGS